MELVKYSRKVILVVLIVLILLVGAGLYSLSGLPIPWGTPTPEARERAEFQRLAAIAEMAKASSIHGQALDGGRIRALVSESGSSIGSIKYASPTEELGCVILIGEHVDTNGMVWALTSTGRVVKISTR